jgi:tetratricopeptide (TPR) repeat protein
MDLEGLLEELKSLNDSGDFDRLRAIREEIIEHHEDSEHAVEAIYRLGLDRLFRERNFDEALQAFERAAKRKHPYWSAAARTSMGICLYHQGRKQKAILELRKVGFVEAPSEHSVASLAFIETIFLNEGDADDVIRTRKERIKQLEKLINGARDEGDKPVLGYHLYAFGLANLDANEPSVAKEALLEAKQLGPDILGAELFRAVCAAC